MKRNGEHTVTLKDQASGNRVILKIRDGVVVGAMGSDPKRYIGLTEPEARHKARYAKKNGRRTRRRRRR